MTDEELKEIFSEENTYFPSTDVKSKNYSFTDKEVIYLVNHINDSTASYILNHNIILNERMLLHETIEYMYNKLDFDRFLDIMYLNKHNMNKFMGVLLTSDACSDIKELIKLMRFIFRFFQSNNLIHICIFSIFILSDSDLDFIYKNDMDLFKEIFKIVTYCHNKLIIGKFDKGIISQIYDLDLHKTPNGRFKGNKNSKRVRTGGLAWYKSTSDKLEWYNNSVAIIENRINEIYYKYIRSKEFQSKYIKMFRNNNKNKINTIKNLETAEMKMLSLTHDIDIVETFDEELLDRYVNSNPFFVIWNISSIVNDTLPIRLKEKFCSVVFESYGFKNFILNFYLRNKYSDNKFITDYLSAIENSKFNIFIKNVINAPEKFPNYICIGTYMKNHTKKMNEIINLIEMVNELKNLN